MNQPTLIFDFDGTIADTHELTVDIFNSFAGTFNYDHLPWDDIDLFKNMNAKEIITHLNIPLLKIPALIKKMKEKYFQNILQTEPFAGLMDVLQQLKNKNVTIGILSSNSKDSILKFLDHHKINMFDFIHTTPQVLGKHTAIKDLIKSNGFSLDNVIYIGDEIRDILAARKLNLKIASVTWGYNSEESLTKHEPSYLIKKPEELLNLIEENNG